MALEDVDWINLALDKHRWLDVVKKFAGFAECRECVCLVRNCQLVGKDLFSAVGWPNHRRCTSTWGQAFAGGLVRAF